MSEDSPIDDGFDLSSEPQREINERNFNRGIDQLMLRHEGVTFVYHRVNTIEGESANLYSEERLQDLLSQNSLAAEVLSDEIMRMKQAYDEGAGITAEDALTKDNDFKDILSATTILVTLDLVTDYIPNLEDLEVQEWWKVREALRETFELASKCGAKVFIRDEEGIIGFDIQLDFELHNELLIRREEFSDILLAHSPEMEGMECFSVGELVLIFE